MTARNVLFEVWARGVVLSVDGSALRYHAPRNALTPGLRRELERNKAEIVDMLMRSPTFNGLPTPEDGDFDDPLDVRYFRPDWSDVAALKEQIDSEIEDGCGLGTSGGQVGHDVWVDQRRFPLVTEL